MLRRQQHGQGGKVLLVPSGRLSSEPGLLCSPQLPCSTLRVKCLSSIVLLCLSGRLRDSMGVRWTRLSWKSVWGALSGCSSFHASNVEGDFFVLLWLTAVWIWQGSHGQRHRKRHEPPSPTVLIIGERRPSLILVLFAYQFVPAVMNVTVCVKCVQSIFMTCLILGFRCHLPQFLLPDKTVLSARTASR